MSARSVDILNVQDELGTDHPVGGMTALELSVQDGRPWGRILVADDEGQVRRMMVEQLREAGWACDGVGTAREALMALTTGSYDLLITDVHMPDNDSLTFLHTCQQGPAPVPVIVVTSYPSVGTAVEAVRLSVVDYLVKPVDEESLLASVHRAIGNGHVLRALRKAREEMRVWSEAMDILERSMTASDRAAIGTTGVRPTESMLGQTVTLLSHVAASLNTLAGAMKNEKTGEGGADVCALLRCRRSAEYEEALRQAVAVLMNSKNSFKSKELGELRKTLVRVLKHEPGC